ncbi:FemAB family PEP-CTERM system-associated protein [Candidatus Woesearchaeota archaeon]|nr:FemAB family PEP-CTERM system-associated protein [Candidatus Woesearchaeota archaeon]
MKADAITEKEWDLYIKAHPQSCFFHQLKWKEVLQQTFSYTPFYLRAIKDGTLTGVLPLFLVKDKVTGTKLLSLPFSTQAGMLYDDEEAKNNLLKQALTLARQHTVNYVELRHLANPLLPWTSRAVYYTLLLELHSDPELVWRKFNKKVRNSTRKAMHEGLRVQIVNAPVLIEQFYKVFAINMRDLGTPVDRFVFFANIVKAFPEDVKIVGVFKGEQYIGGIMLFFYKDTVKSEWASSLREYFHLCPNNLAYWEAIQYACKLGIKTFDFGRSLWNDGTFKFKEHFGAKPVQLHYHYHVIKGSVMDVTKRNIKRKVFAMFWKQLPLSVANKLGPIFRERFP